MSMHTRSPFVDGPTPGEHLPSGTALNPSELIARDPARKNQRSALGWWYRLTAPKEAPDSAPLSERERARRGRLISAVMFFAAVLFTLGTFIGILGPNRFIAFATLFSLVILAISSQFNRKGHTNVAGLMIPLGFNIALIAVTLSSPLSPTSIQLYDLLVFSEVFAASLLPPNGWVLTLFALGNLIFIQADITLQPHTHAFAAILATDVAAIRIRPIVIHVVITGVIWLWVRSASLAIARADRAEVIANLEHVVAEQERTVAQQKRKLEQSMQEIVDVHIRVANGDLRSRVSLSSENVLWQVAVPLNNLIARFQRMYQELQQSRKVEHDLQQTRIALTQAVYLIKMAKAGQRPSAIPQTGTLVDPVLHELKSILLPPDPIH